MYPGGEGGPLSLKATPQHLAAGAKTVTTARSACDQALTEGSRTIGGTEDDMTADYEDDVTPDDRCDPSPTRTALGDTAAQLSTALRRKRTPYRGERTT